MKRALGLQLQVLLLSVGEVVVEGFGVVMVWAVVIVGSAVGADVVV